MKADICVFACTGHVGSTMARHIVEQLAASTRSASSSTTILLAGRNIDKVRDLRARLLDEITEKNNVVNILVLEDAVDVDNDDALLSMVSRARVVANCIDVDCHPRALEAVAEACTKADGGVHYLDLAAQYSQLQPLFFCHRLNKPPCNNKSRIVPGSGFDYAFFDVAILQAERVFSERYGMGGAKPDSVQVTLALRTGPLGIKWSLRLVKRYLEASSASTSTKASNSKTAAPSHQTPHEKSSGNMLAYIKPLSSWSIRWPLGGDALTFLLCQRHWTHDKVDVRMALPLVQSLWKAALLALYGLVAAACVAPLLIAARYLKIGALQNLLLYRLLPIVSLGILTNDQDLCHRSFEQLRVELVVMLTRNENERQSLCYRVMAPSPEILNPLCMALSALELAKATTSNDDEGGGGVLTPAMALGETDFWSRLQNACDLKTQITEESGVDGH